MKIERRPERILMTCDAVGGVWRYAVDLAGALKQRDIHVILAVLGPPPTPGQRREADAVSTTIEVDLPLDWTVDDAAKLAAVPARLADLADDHAVDLVHLNLPSQAAGFPSGLPLLAVSHSCTVTWFASVRGTDVPLDWAWQRTINRIGLQRADHVVAPSASHAGLLQATYGSLPNLSVIHNASAVPSDAASKDRFAFAVGRWWDEGKNARVLDDAAPMIGWPVVMAGAHSANGQGPEIRNALLHGALPHDEAMALMRRAAILVSPSLYEPFGLAALEGARSGCALVLADIPTYRELWDGCALFFDPRDARDLARQVNRLAVDERLRRQLACCAHRHARRYTLDAQAAAYGRLYDAVRRPVVHEIAAE